MKLTQPTKVRELLAREKNWLTVNEVASGLQMHPNTVRKMFRGETVNEDTIRTIAQAIDKHPLDIASFVN